MKGRSHLLNYIIKILVPAASLQQPTRIFARAINEKCTLRLMDGEMQASKILQFLPIKFNADIELGKFFYGLKFALVWYLKISISLILGR